MSTTPAVAPTLERPWRLPTAPGAGVWLLARRSPSPAGEWRRIHFLVEHADGGVVPCTSWESDPGVAVRFDRQRDAELEATRRRQTGQPDASAASVRLFVVTHARGVELSRLSDARLL